MNEKTRRDYLYITTGAFGAIAIAGAAWPLVAQLGPDEQVVANRNLMSVDLSQIEEGGQVTVLWKGKPYFIRHLTDAEILTAQQADFKKFRKFVPASTRLHGHGQDKPKWSVVGAACTHLGCVLHKRDSGVEALICPCHGARFDVVGRVMKGPAPTNLPQPHFEFRDENTIVFGEGQNSQIEDAMKQTGH